MEDSRLVTGRCELQGQGHVHEQAPAFDNRGTHMCFADQSVHHMHEGNNR